MDYSCDSVGDEHFNLIHRNQIMSDIKETDNEQIPKQWLKIRIPVRYMVVAACTVAALAMSLMRMSMGMAIVCMTNHSAILSHETTATESQTLSYCPSSSENITDSNRRFAEDGPFVWSDTLQGVILSSFFWGYCVTQFPAGIMVEKFSGKRILAVAILSSSLLFFAIPFTATHFHVAYVIVLIVGIGIAQGFLFPIVYAIVSRWAPKGERSRMITFALAGFGISQMMASQISASLCSWDPDNGWKYIFYLFGGCGIIGFLCWIIVVDDHPNKHRWISNKESSYIRKWSECSQQPRNNIRIPWSAILKSAPFWALVWTEFAFSFRGNVLQVDLPTYMKVIMNFDIKRNGIINTIPYITKGGLGLVAAFISDAIVSSGKLSVTSIRKTIVATIIAVSCVCLLGVTMAGCNKVLVVILLGIAISIEGLSLIGLYMNVIDLAPNFVGVLKGVANTASALGNLAAPSIVGLMISNDNSISSWNNVFYLISGFNVIICFIFLTFASGNVQQWNKIELISTDNANRTGTENSDFEDLLTREQSQPTVN